MVFIVETSLTLVTRCRDGALRGLMEDLPTICAAAEKILENSETVFPPEAEGGATVNQTWGGAADFADGSV
jgi:hypothetical protein